MVDQIDAKRAAPARQEPEKLERREKEPAAASAEKKVAANENNDSRDKLAEA